MKKLWSLGLRELFPQAFTCLLRLSSLLGACGALKTECWQIKLFLHLLCKSLNLCATPTLKWIYVKSYLVRGVDKYCLQASHLVFFLLCRVGFIARHLRCSIRRMLTGPSIFYTLHAWVKIFAWFTQNGLLLHLGLVGSWIHTNFFLLPGEPFRIFDIYQESQADCNREKKRRLGSQSEQRQDSLI